MNPLLLLALGLAIVLGGILWLRLHPFLALILRAFAVGGLTGADHLKAAMQAKYRGELTRAAIQDEVVREIEALKKDSEPFDAQVIPWCPTYSSSSEVRALAESPPQIIGQIGQHEDRR